MRRSASLQKSAEFGNVRKHGRRVGDGLIAFGVVRADGDTTRFGLAVSKRVGGSVTRNRVKRRLRECLTSLEIPAGYNIVVSARPAAAKADYHMLLSSVTRLARRAGVLLPEAATPGGTDPAENYHRRTESHRPVTEHKVTRRNVKRETD